VHSIPPGQSASKEHGKPSFEPPAQYKSLHIPLGQSTSGGWHGGATQHDKPLLEPPRQVWLHASPWNPRYRALPSLAGRPPEHGSFKRSPLVMQSLIHPENPQGYSSAGQARQESGCTQESAGFTVAHVPPTGQVPPPRHVASLVHCVPGLLPPTHTRQFALLVHVMPSTAPPTHVLVVSNCRKVLFQDNSASILETARLGGGQSSKHVPPGQSEGTLHASPLFVPPTHLALDVLHPLATAYSESCTVDPARTVVGPDARHSSFTHRYGSLGAGGLSTQDPLLHLERTVHGLSSSHAAPWLMGWD
jgi:hypothetical protein